MIFFLLAACAAVTIICLAFRRNLSDARARLIDDARSAITSFGRLEYALVGEGVPVLVIHGACGGFDQSVQMARALAERGYRLIAPSRFGYLGSTFPSGLTTSMQADAYAQLLDALGVKQVFVVAISAGEWSAMQFAIRYPHRCRALALIVPADHLPPGTLNHGGALVRAIFASDFIAWAVLKVAPFCPGAIRTMLGTDPKLVRDAEPAERVRVYDILERLLPVSARYAGTQFDIETATLREPFALESITCPVLTISAADDAFGTDTRAEWIAEGVPDGMAVIFPIGGHALVGRYSDALNAVVSFFRSSMTPRDPVDIRVGGTSTSSSAVRTRSFDVPEGSGRVNTRLPVVDGSIEVSNRVHA